MSGSGDEEQDDERDPETGKARSSLDVLKWAHLCPPYNGTKEGGEYFEDKLDNTLAMFEEEDERIWKKLGPLIRGRLTGKAWSHVRKMERSEYCCPDGLLERLRPHCQDQKQPRVKDAMNKLLKQVVRRIGESTVDFLGRLEVCMAEMRDVADFKIEGVTWSHILIDKYRLAEAQETMLLTATQGSYEPGIIEEKIKTALRKIHISMRSPGLPRRETGGRI